MKNKPDTKCSVLIINNKDDYPYVAAKEDWDLVDLINKKDIG